MNSVLVQPRIGGLCDPARWPDPGSSIATEATPGKVISYGLLQLFSGLQSAGEQWRGEQYGAGR